MGLRFWPPPRSGGLGTLGEGGQLTRVSALWTWSLGGWRKPNDATPTASSSWGRGPGGQESFPQVSLQPLLLGLAWSLHRGSSWDSSSGSTAGVPRAGEEHGTQICETCTFSKEDEEGHLGSGLALEGGADTHLLGLDYRGLLHQGGRGPRKGRRKLLGPSKGQRSLTLCLEISA